MLYFKLVRCCNFLYLLITKLTVPGVDPVLCYLVWGPHSPVRWWQDTWDMAAGRKGQ